MAFDHLVTFTIDERLFALPLAAVERVVRAAEITPLPKAPAIVLGIVNLQGELIPVMNIRRRFRIREREIDLDDQFIIAHLPGRKVALLVDRVRDISPSPREVVPAESVLPDLEYVTGVSKTEDGMIFICDLSRFLSLEEEQALDGATGI